MGRRGRIAAIAISSIIGIALLIAVISYAVSESGKVTGDEWFYEQTTYVDELTELADSTDDIVTLYITGSIGEDDFINHLSILQVENKAMQTAYNQQLHAHPVKTGTYSYYAKYGCEAVEACYPLFDEMYSVLADDAADPDQVSYLYLSYQQKFIEKTSEYITACYYMYDIEGEVEDEEDASEALGEGNENSGNEGVTEGRKRE